MDSEEFKTPHFIFYYAKGGHLWAVSKTMYYLIVKELL